MAETQKPLEVAPATQEPVVTADAPAAPVPETVTPAVEPLVPETHKQETAVTDAPAESTEATTAPAEEKVTKHAEPVEPIYHGALGYKPSGGLKGLYYSKKYFFFGEETPVDTQSLGQYLRGEKPEVAHPTAAWSSHTGKGVLYFVKHASSKDTPQGALLLADATDVQKEGTTEFSFKIAGHKHSFQAVSSPERNGWLLAVEKVVEEAKTAREEIVNSEGYKATIEKLGKPAALAVTGSTSKAESATPKKSTDVKPTEALQRAGSSSSSSSSSDEEKKAKKNKSKSRSVSRGKRTSIFGSLLGKKEEHDEKKEVKKEVKAEEKEAESAKPAVDTIATAPVAIPAETPATPLPEERATTTDATPAPVTDATTETPAAETPKTEAKPKPAKRGSVFGSFFEKVRSPTHEKKEHEVLPAVPAKDESTTETAPPALPEPTAESKETPIPAAQVAPAAETTTAAETTEPKEAKVTTPKKESTSLSFGKFFKKAEAVVAKPVEKTTEKPATETTETHPATETPATTTETPVATEAPSPTSPTEGKEKRRASFFGTLTGKKEKTEGETTDGEKTTSKLGGLFRNPSKAIKSKKETKPADKPEESTETPVAAPVVSEKPTESQIALDTKVEPLKPQEEPKSIGDVVGDAVHTGSAPNASSTPVHATA